MVFFRHWVGAVSTLGSFVALIAGVKGKGPGPWWLWIVIAYASLAFGLGFEWWKEHRRAAVFEALKTLCDETISDLEELADLFLNAPKKEGEPKTLPDPMAPWWASSEWKVWPYRVGVFQGRATSLRQSLRKTTIPVEEWDSHISVPKVLDSLRKYRAQLDKLS